jgi:DNA invertase Pin-like site-specific DNA recombinase
MTKPNKGGRPPHEPTPQLRSQVESMCGFGIPADEIARSIGISADTLRKYYREELDNGTTKANTAVAQSLYKKALGDGTSAVTAAIFWLKTRAGWKETLNVNHEGEVRVGLIERRVVDPKS